MSNTQAPEPAGGPRIGVDEWVARSGERIGAAAGIQRLWQKVPPPVAFAGTVALLALVPVMTSDLYVLRVGADTLIYALLCLGLNVAVGWAGILDLSYIAFFGFGAYGYALTSSDLFHQHWPSYASVPAVVAATGLLGIAIGLTSWRLVGDYLAIVTLFFAQIFSVILLNGNRLSVFGGHFWLPKGNTNLTGGPNGIAGIDPIHLGGGSVESVRGYFWLLLIAGVVVFALLTLLKTSRPGRAWRALREDPLAAEMMSTPVDRLKLVAYGLGAAVAGLTGCIFAALNTGVFPQTFDVPYLITIYSMVILGGEGSLPGVVIGAIVVNVSLEVLRTPDHATWLVYGVLIVTILAKLRPWALAAYVLGGTAALGFATHAIVGAITDSATSGKPASTGFVGDIARHFALAPSSGEEFGKWAFVALLLAVCGLVVAPWRRLAKIACLPVVFYLLVLAWENLLGIETATTRILLVGALLIVLMAARPQGILGRHRVEVV